jgi:hypothetical protein
MSSATRDTIIANGQGHTYPEATFAQCDEGLDRPPQEQSKAIFGKLDTPEQIVHQNRAATDALCDFAKRQIDELIAKLTRLRASVDVKRQGAHDSNDILIRTIAQALLAVKEVDDKANEIVAGVLNGAPKNGHAQ